MADKFTSTIEKIVNSLTWLGLLLMAFVPEKWMIDNGISLCLHKLLTGYECPLCGMTKATWCFSHFRFYDALIYNPVFYLLLAIFFLWTFKVWLKIQTGNLMKASLYILLTAFVVLYISRFF
jgi:hypothetical protein